MKPIIRVENLTHIYGQDTPRQLADLLADGGLGKIVLICGLGKALVLCYRNKIFQLIEIHTPPRYYHFFLF